jgi:hypothetical protein
LRAGRSALEIFSRKGYLILGIFGFPLDNHWFSVSTLWFSYSAACSTIIISAFLCNSRLFGFTRCLFLSAPLPSPAYISFTRASSFAFFCHPAALSSLLFLLRASSFRVFLSQFMFAFGSASPRPRYLHHLGSCFMISSTFLSAIFGWRLFPSLGSFDISYIISWFWFIRRIFILAIYIHSSCSFR